MARYIYCRECGDKKSKLHPSDVQMGWTERSVFLSTKLPEGHGIRMNGEFTPLTEVVCDCCSKGVTGEVAVAVTFIPPEREIGPWEHEYGTVLTEDAVKLIDAMEGKEASK
jgi:hypothetical protein